MELGDRCSLAAMPVWLVSAVITLGVLVVERITRRHL